MSKPVSKYFNVFETRDHPRRFWNKDMTRHYVCVKCGWDTSFPTKSYGAMGALLTSQRVALELAFHLKSHKKKKKKGKK